MKGKKITALVLSLALVVGVPAAVLADEPDEAEGSEQAIVEEVPEETEVTEVTEATSPPQISTRTLKLQSILAVLL